MDLRDLRALDYYKELLRYVHRPNISLKSDFYGEDEKISVEENTRCTEEEIRKLF